MSQAEKSTDAPIQLNDFRARWEESGGAVLDAVGRVGRSGWLVLGGEVAAFEEELARHWGLAFCVGCGSGLDAIEISLRCLGLEPEEQVLTTPLSAFATTLAVVRAGGRPLFVDVDPAGQLDLDLVEEVLGEREDVRWLLPVHLYGHALDLRRLEALRERFGLRIVEDCAQAIGARSWGRPVGSVAEAAATSFYPTKNLGCMGDGGALLTQRASVAERARSLRDYGQSGKYEHRHLGLNSRLDELHAAILRSAFLPQLERWTKRRIEIAHRYRCEIRNPELVLPDVPEGSESVWHLFPVLVADDRASFQDHLRGAGVATGVHYPLPIPDQEAFKEWGAASVLTPLPRARLFCTREVSLPIHPYLSDPDVERVIDACNTWRR